jgi:hypothetical protein
MPHCGAGVPEGYEGRAAEKAAPAASVGKGKHRRKHSSRGRAQYRENHGPGGPQTLTTHNTDSGQQGERVVEVIPVREGAQRAEPTNVLEAGLRKIFVSEENAVGQRGKEAQTRRGTAGSSVICR